MAKLITEEELDNIRNGLNILSNVKDSLAYSAEVAGQEAAIDRANTVRTDAGLDELNIEPNEFREANKDMTFGEELSESFKGFNRKLGKNIQDIVSTGTENIANSPYMSTLTGYDFENKEFYVSQLLKSFNKNLIEEDLVSQMR